ncbi:MAG: prepilin-type N-terminal cleavage/methylation domain-containing protein [Armatimonadota bacterium]
MKRPLSTQRGFTLIELLIVIVVIAILALIVIPHLMSGHRKASEAALRANLHQLRIAVASFEADTGSFPTDLNDLVAPGEANLVTSGIPSGTYRGPYLTPGGGIAGSGLPINPLGPTNSTTAQINQHWTYADGVVGSAVTGNTIDGIPYAQL